MENAIDKEARIGMQRAWTLDQLKKKEEKRYPSLSISIWHTGDIYDIDYMNEGTNCLTIHLTPDMKYKGAEYTEERYNEEIKAKNATMVKLPDDLKPIYDKYIKTFGLANSIDGEKPTQEETYER